MRVCIEVRGHLFGVGSHLPPLYGFQGSNSGSKVCTSTFIHWAILQALIPRGWIHREKGWKHTNHKPKRQVSHFKVTFLLRNRDRDKTGNWMDYFKAPLLHKELDRRTTTVTWLKLAAISVISSVWKIEAWLSVRLVVSMLIWATLALMYKSGKMVGQKQGLL